MSFTGQNIADMAMRELFDKADESYLTDMVEYINEGVRRLAIGTNCCQEILDYDQTGYRLLFSTIVSECSDVNSVLTIGTVYFKPSSTYIRLHKDDVASSANFLVSTAIAPTRWKQFAESILFDAALDAMSLRLLFSYMPDSIASRTETVPLPDECIDALAKYVVFCCRLADRDAGLANGAFGEYEILREMLAEKYAMEMTS